MTNKKQENNILYLIIWILMLAVLWLVVYIFSLTPSNVNLDNVKNTTNNQKQEILVISDKRCTNCPPVDPIIEQLKTKIPALASATYTKKDFSEVKDYVKKSGITALPAFVFNSNNIDPNINSFLIPLENGKYILNIWATFDPFAEICWNWVDDNEDGKIDCEDPKCKNTLACAPKVDKPKAELYVMSYCPYWTQAQKWFLQVMDKLWKVADTEIHFVNYIMHGEKEWEQNLREYCIQKEQKDKFNDYLRCFLKAWDYEGCLKEANIDEKKLQACIDKTKKEINYDKNMADKTRRFPLFDLETNKNEQYQVQGSPTFVLNWVKVENVWRNAKAYADLICNSFKEKPEECNFDFDTTTYDPNFWFTSQWKAVSWGCGGQ